MVFDLTNLEKNSIIFILKGDKMYKLDYTLQSPEERKALVNEIIADAEAKNEPLNSGYLETLGDYLIFGYNKEERKKVLTDNRMVTINKRETSFEGLVDKLENGEDTIYNLITDNNKNSIFRPKVTITKKDIAEIPFLQQMTDTIDELEKALKVASGKDAYIIKKTLIDLRKDRYIVKQAYQKPVQLKMTARGLGPVRELPETNYMDHNGEIYFDGSSLMDPEMISSILCKYSKLKSDSWDKLDDTWAMMIDFDNVAEAALQDFPYYHQLLIYKIDGMSNQNIQQALQEEFGIKHSLEYISSL